MIIGTFPSFQIGSITNPCTDYRTFNDITVALGSTQTPATGLWANSITCPTTPTCNIIYSAGSGSGSDDPSGAPGDGSGGAIIGTAGGRCRCGAQLGRGALRIIVVIVQQHIALLRGRREITLM